MYVFHFILYYYVYRYSFVLKLIYNYNYIFLYKMPICVVSAIIHIIWCKSFLSNAKQTPNWNIYLSMGKGMFKVQNHLALLLPHSEAIYYYTSKQDQPGIHYIKIITFSVRFCKDMWKWKKKSKTAAFSTGGKYIIV